MATTAPNKTRKQYYTGTEMLALQRATNDYSKQFFARVELSAASSLLRVGE